MKSSAKTHSFCLLLHLRPHITCPLSASIHPKVPRLSSASGFASNSYHVRLLYCRSAPVRPRRPQTMASDTPDLAARLKQLRSSVEADYNTLPMPPDRAISPERGRLRSTARRLRSHTSNASIFQRRSPVCTSAPWRACSCHSVLHTNRCTFKIPLQVLQP